MALLTSAALLMANHRSMSPDTSLQEIINEINSAYASLEDGFQETFRNLSHCKWTCVRGQWSKQQLGSTVHSRRQLCSSIHSGRQFSCSIHSCANGCGQISSRSHHRVPEVRPCASSCFCQTTGHIDPRSIHCCQNSRSMESSTSALCNFISSQRFYCRCLDRQICQNKSCGQEVMQEYQSQAREICSATSTNICSRQGVQS